MPKVFVSYAHDSADHKDQVLRFASFLRAQGIESVLDTWAAATRNDWYSWAIKEMTEADFVIVVASEKYRLTGDGTGPNDLHKGVQSEAALLRDLLWGDREKWRPKILPVLLPGRHTGEIPLFLQPASASRYQVTAFTRQGAEELLRVIHNQPGHIPPPVAETPVFPILSGGPTEPPTEVVWTPLDKPAEVRWCAEIVDHQLANIIELHLVPAGKVSLCSLRRLRELGAELAALGQEHGIFRTTQHVMPNSSSTAAWAIVGGTGLAVLRSGQRSAWFAPRQEPPDEHHLAAELAAHIRLLVEVTLDQPASWAPAVGFGRGIRLDAMESVTDHDLRRMPVDVAEELAARLVAAIREPERPKPAERPASEHIVNKLQGNISGTVIQVGKLYGDFKN